MLTILFTYAICISDTMQLNTGHLLFIKGPDDNTSSIGLHSYIIVVEGIRKITDPPLELLSSVFSKEYWLLKVYSVPSGAQPEFRQWGGGGGANKGYSCCRQRNEPLRV